VLAYIVSAYKNLDQLTRLVDRLNTECSVVYIHVDSKTDDGDYQRLERTLAGRPSVHLLERHVCHWGGFGHVRATLKGIDALLASGSDFEHLVLLTGQDYPIKPLAEIERFFAACRLERMWPGGVHLEFTGEDVTECLGGGEAVLEEQLSARYMTLCDPRLNARQSLDLAFRVAELMRIN
jgi:hypothetical protein